MHRLLLHHKLWHSDAKRRQETRISRILRHLSPRGVVAPPLARAWTLGAAVRGVVALGVEAPPPDRDGRAGAEDPKPVPVGVRDPQGTTPARTGVRALRHKPWGAGGGVFAMLRGVSARGEAAPGFTPVRRGGDALPPTTRIFACLGGALIGGGAAPDASISFA